MDTSTLTFSPELVAQECHDLALRWRDNLTTFHAQPLDVTALCRDLISILSDKINRHNTNWFGPLGAATLYGHLAAACHNTPYFEIALALGDAVIVLVIRASHHDSQKLLNPAALDSLYQSLCDLLGCIDDVANRAGVTSAQNADKNSATN